MLEKSKQLRLGADRDLVQAMKTTQEAVTKAKAFNDKWQDRSQSGLTPMRGHQQEMWWRTFS